MRLIQVQLHLPLYAVCKIAGGRYVGCAVRLGDLQRKGLSDFTFERRKRLRLNIQKCRYLVGKWTLHVHGVCCTVSCGFQHC